MGSPFPAMAALALLLAAGCAGPAATTTSTTTAAPPPPAPGLAYTAFRCPLTGERQASPCLQPWDVDPSVLVSDLAVHPTRPEVVVAAFDAPAPHQGWDLDQEVLVHQALAVSTDGGRTWAVRDVPTTPAAQASPQHNLYGYSGRAKLAFTPDGVLHLLGEGANSNLPGPEPLAYSTLVHVATPDLGATWTDPVVVRPGGDTVAPQTLQALGGQTLAAAVDEAPRSLVLSLDGGASWAWLPELPCLTWSPLRADGARWVAACVDSSAIDAPGPVHVAALDAANGTVRLLDAVDAPPASGAPPHECGNAHLQRLGAKWVLLAGSCPGLDLRAADRPEGPWAPLAADTSALAGWELLDLRATAPDPAGGVFMLARAERPSAAAGSLSSDKALLLVHIDPAGKVAVHDLVVPRLGDTPAWRLWTAEMLTPARDSLWIGAWDGEFWLGQAVPA